MSILVQKGNSFHGKYTADEIVTATDWTGTVKVYTAYPGGTALFTKTLTQSVDNTFLEFTFDASDILNLDAGTYYVVGNIKSVTLGIDTYRIDYMTVTDSVISDQPMTTITMTIAKIDGTPAGEATKTLQNTATGSVIINSWKGVKVTATHTTAYNIDNDIIGTEVITTETNASGYAQLAVIKGSTVTVTCPSFGKSVTIDTIGLDTIDLSTFF